MSKPITDKAGYLYLRNLEGLDDTVRTERLTKTCEAASQFLDDKIKSTQFLLLGVGGSIAAIIGFITTQGVEDGHWLSKSLLAVGLGGLIVALGNAGIALGRLLSRKATVYKFYIALTVRGVACLNDPNLSIGSLEKVINYLCRLTNSFWWAIAFMVVAVLAFFFCFLTMAFGFPN